MLQLLLQCHFDALCIGTQLLEHEIGDVFAFVYDATQQVDRLNTLLMPLLGGLHCGLNCLLCFDSVLVKCHLYSSN